MLFTALHRLLGRLPGPITDDMIDDAVTNGLVETDDLDWKRKLIQVKDLPLSDFPKDVAAMANRGGGLLVYGVEEADKKATGRIDVGSFDERYEAALLSAAVTAISPPVFNLRVHWVGGTGNQVMVVVIPATSDVPHLIYKGEYFAAPIRNDASTVWMKERQVEALYRARFEERRHSTETLGNLYDDAALNWATPSRAWLIAVAHPQLPSTATKRPDRHDARAVFAAAKKNTLLYSGRGGGHPIEAVDHDNPRPGLRRWVAPNKSIADAGKDEAWMAVHHDGSVTQGAAIGGQRTRDGHLEQHQIDSAAIEIAVSDFMGLIRATSEKVGLSSYEVRVGIEWIGSTPLNIQNVDSSGHLFAYNSTPLAKYTSITRTVFADSAPLDFYWQVHDLAEDCINQGGISDVIMITPPDRPTSES
jgi:hypothetical protein